MVHKLPTAANNPRASVGFRPWPWLRRSTKLLGPARSVTTVEPVRLSEVAADRAAASATAIGEPAPAASHNTVHYANDRVEADHARLKMGCDNTPRLRPSRDPTKQQCPSTPPHDRMARSAGVHKPLVPVA